VARRARAPARARRARPARRACPAAPFPGGAGVTVAAVLLAAGGGSRFTASGGSGHKLLAPYLGRTVVEWSIDSAVAAHLDATYVVRGAVELPLPSLAAGQVRFVRNDRWRDGMATSLQAGITRARRDGHAAVVVGLGDQPLVQPEAWRRLARAARTPLAVATYEGVRGNPVRLSSLVWPLLPRSGDEGARLVMRRRPDLVTEVPCPGRSADIDTVGDLDEWS
jgi:molybdenum cofactor cytidylyltransferase